MQIKVDLKSKLLDGILTFLVLTLLGVLVSLLIRPVLILFGKPGLLVYTMVVLSGAVIALERCTTLRFDEPTRALWGMSGGVLAWLVVELSNLLGDVGLTSGTGIIALMLVGSVVFLLWKRTLPVGVRFFGLALLASWAMHIILTGQNFIGQMEPTFAATYQVSGYGAIGSVALILGYIFFYSRTRTQRLWASLALWICTMVLIYVFRGGLI